MMEAGTCAKTTPAKTPETASKVIATTADDDHGDVYDHHGDVYDDHDDVYDDHDDHDDHDDNDNVYYDQI